MRIARELIDPDADKVVRRLARHGFQAYLVGGCVRDLLLARTPKDFDVATNATPKEIRQLFRNCRIIGRRFRLAHIFFGPKIIETSTFRANPREGDEVDDSDEILIRRDNVFGTDTEDARRRDFTINGLFYDLEAERVIDHVGGLEDLERRVVSTIGDPDIRFREDPVRMLRAVKFAARLGFEIEHATLAALIRHRSEIAKCPQPRVLEELYRLLRGGAARRSLALLIDTGLASILSPHLAAMFGQPPPMPEPTETDPPTPRFIAPAGSPLPARSEIRAGAQARPGAVATARPLVGDEAAWAAVWEEEEITAERRIPPPGGDTIWAGAIAADPALAHDHEIEDVHDAAEEADFQAELHELAQQAEDGRAPDAPSGEPGQDAYDDVAAGAPPHDDADAEAYDDDDDDDDDDDADDDDGPEADAPPAALADDGGADFDDEHPTHEIDDVLGDRPTREIEVQPGDRADADADDDDGPLGALPDDQDDDDDDDDADFDDEPPTRELDQPLVARGTDTDDEVVTNPAAPFDAAAAEDDEHDEEDFDDEDDEDFDDAGEPRRGDDAGAGHGSQLFHAAAAGVISFAPSAESMVHRRTMAWGMLDQLDIAFRRGGELSNSLLLAALCTPFVFEELLEGEVRPLEAHDVALEVLLPLVQQLQIARRDAERCRQIMLAQRRLAPARRRRGKPMSLVRREFFRDALVVHQMMGHVSGFDVSDLSYWSKLHAQGDGAPPASSAASGPGRPAAAAAAAEGGDDSKSSGGKKRRRRRGGRRRRRTTNGQPGGDWEPVVGG